MYTTGVRTTSRSISRGRVRCMRFCSREKLGRAALSKATISPSTIASSTGRNGAPSAVSSG